MHGDPFRTVHLGGARRIGGGAGAHQHVGLIGETVGHRQRALAMHQRHPLAHAVVIEARDIQRALIKDAAIGIAVAAVDAVARHKFVDVFENTVIAHVDHQAAVVRRRGPRAFMAETAQCGAFHRLRLRIVRIELNHPAVAIRFIGMFAGVKTLVEFIPAVTAALGRNAVAALVRRNRAAVDEVGVPVFLASQVRAPGRITVGAIVEGSEHRLAHRIRGSLHQRVACRRTADAHRRPRRDAARERGRPHHFPFPALLAHFDHRAAIGVLRLAHLVGIPVGKTVGMQQAVVGIFVVHHQKAAAGALGSIGQRKVVDAVMVHPRLQRLLFSGVAGILTECRRTGRVTNGIAPGIQHVSRIPLWDANRVSRRR